MSTRTEELRYLWRLDLADDVTKPLLKATREQERALAVQERALKKVGDTSGRVSQTQKAAARTTANAAGLRAREAQRAAEREISSLSRTGKAYQTLGREAQAAARQRQEAARRASAATRKQREDAQRDLRRAGSRATGPARAAATGVAAAGGFGLAALIDNYVSFEKQMSKVRAVTQATDDEFKQLQSTALDLGQKTAFNNREVAAAMTELATAGFTTEKIIKTLPGTLDLASATGYDLAASAELQASTLRAFGLSAKDATHVADVLTNTANKSAVGMDDLAESLSYVAPVAKTFNQSMEDMLASAGILGNVGIKGSQMGTTVRTALTRLAAPSKQAQESLDKLRISTSDLYGPKGMRPLPEIIGKIVKGTQGMKASERDAALTRLFGREALAGMLKLVDQGEGKYRNFSKTLKNSDGAAKKSAEVMRDNVAGAWDQFTGSVESAAAALLTKYSPAVKTALADAGDFVDGLAGAEPKRKVTRDAQGRVTGVKVTELNDAQKAGKEFAKTLDQINEGAQDIIGPLGKFAGWAAEIGRANPWLVKTIGSLIALRVAWKAIKITSAGTGLTGFLRTLNRVGGADGVSLGGRIISGIRSKVSGGGGVIRSALRKVLGSAGTAAGDRAAATTAESLAENLPASVRARRGRYRVAGRIVGGVFAAGAAAVIGIKIGEAIEDALDPKHHQDKFDEWSNSALPKWLQGIQNARQDAADWLKDLIPGGRKGGVVGRFQGGGVVPAMVSSGEEIHHGGRVWTVPGQPTAADNVFAMLPMGAGVVTFDGQRRMAGGASLGEAIAHQAPHFAAGGFVTKASWFNDGQTKSGLHGAGIAVNAPGLGHRGTYDKYAKQMWRVQHLGKPGRTRNLQQVDEGPNDWVASKHGRRIDFLPAAAKAMGIEVGKITDERFRVTPAGGASSSSSGKYRTLGRSRTRGGILSDAFEQGLSAGQEGRATPGVLSAIQQAGKVTARTTSRSSSSSSSRSSYKDGAVTYDGKQIAGWIKPHLDYMRSHGWTGRVNEGVRSHAEQTRLWNGAPGNGLVRGVTVAKPGESNHRGAKWPLGAVDLTDWQSAKAANRSRAQPGPLKWYGPRDPVHFSATGHRRGGIIGYRSGGTTPKGWGRAPISELPNIFTRLYAAFGDASELYLLRTRSQLRRAARKGGDERVVKHYQKLISAIDAQLGFRIGRIQARIERRNTVNDFTSGLVERRLRQRGAEPDSSQGIGVTRQLQDQVLIPRLRANLRDAQGAVRKAVRAGASTGRVRELQQGVTEALAALDEGLVSRAELRRQQIRQFAQDVVDDAQFRSDWNNAGLAFLDASQRVQGTAGTSEGMRQRATAIEQSFPALQAVQTAFQVQAQAALKTGDLAGWRQAMLSAQGAATDLANAQADAADLIKQAAYQQVQDAQDATGFTASVGQTQLEGLGLQQQLGGTYDTATGRQQRASFIRDTIIPGVQAEIAAAKTAVDTARQQDGEQSEAYRQAVLRYLGLQNELTQDQVEATQLVAENTEPLREFQGSSAFELNGQQFLAGLLGVGSGA